MPGKKGNANTGVPKPYNAAKVFDIVYTVGETQTRIRGLNRTQCRDQLKELEGYTVMVYKDGVPLLRCDCGFIGGRIRQKKSNRGRYFMYSHSLTGECDTCDMSQEAS